MLDDPEVVAGSEKFVTLIIRRPYAYAFVREHEGAVLTGVAFLDGDGTLKGSSRLKAATEVVKEMERVLE